MELSEIQTVELLREYDVPLPICGIADSPDAARDLCAEIGGRSWVVKAGLKPDERVALEPRIECTSPDAVGRAAARAPRVIELAWGLVRVHYFVILFYSGGD